MKKGFYLTIDGLFALTILIVALAIISSQLFQPTIPRAVYLKQLSLDTIKVLDNSGRINSALVNSNSSVVREVFEQLPVNICMQIHLENSGNGTTITIAKPGCGGFGDQLQTTYRSISSNGIRYITRLDSWYDN